MGSTILYVNAVSGDTAQQRQLDGFSRYASGSGWNIKTLWRFEFDAPLVAKLAARPEVAGIVVDCTVECTKLPLRVFHGKPTVWLHPQPALHRKRVPMVLHDNVAITRMAMRELSTNHPAAYAAVGFLRVSVGHRRTWATIRIGEAEKFARAAGVPFFSFAAKNAYALRDDKTLPGWIASLPHKCAIFAVNDDVASVVLAATRATGRSVPRDLTLVGVDDNRLFCEAASPGISTVALDFERSGYLGARLLDSLLGRGAKGAETPSDEPPSCLFAAPLFLVRRETTRRNSEFTMQLRTAVEAVRTEACNGLSAGALAARFHCSRSYFERQFRAATGHSVQDEILNVRLEKVYSLLARQDIAIGAIAGLCGFRSNIALHKLFRSRHGISMHEWRKRNIV